MVRETFNNFCETFRGCQYIFFCNPELETINAICGLTCRSGEIWELNVGKSETVAKYISFDLLFGLTVRNSINKVTGIIWLWFFDTVMIYYGWFKTLKVMTFFSDVDEIETSLKMEKK